MKALVKRLNTEKIAQTQIDWNEDLPKHFWEKYFSSATEVADNLDISRHRWYNTSITVVQLDSGDYIGVRHVSDLHSEEMMVEDIYHYLEFFEMVPKTVTTFVKAKENEFQK